MKRISLGLLGATGKMGGHVLELLESDYADAFKLEATPTRDDDLGALLKCAVVVDFALPEAMVRVAQACLTHAGPLPAFVVGSTGWSAEQEKILTQLATKTSVLKASNFSAGVHLLVRLLETARVPLERLGYEPSIVEIHHTRKKDAPSGTAVTLARAISPQNPSTVKIESVREGDVVGEHFVTFTGAADTITLSHSAQDRSVFARGALDTALWLAVAHPTGKVLSIQNYFDVLFKGAHS